MVDVEDVVMQLVRERYERSDSLPRTLLDRRVEGAIAQDAERMALLKPRIDAPKEVSSLYRPSETSSRPSPLTILRRKVADTAMACLMFAEAIAPQGLVSRRSDISQEINSPPVIVETMEQTTTFSIVETAALQLPTDVVERSEDP